MRPTAWFCISLAVLLGVNVASVMSSSWLLLPPKPDGDGPDYENIGFHLARGDGFVFDNSDPSWQQPYADRATIYAQRLDTPHRDMIATWRPPLFPLLIGVIYKSIGRSPSAWASVRVFSAVCMALAGAIAIALIGRLLNGYAHPRVSDVACMSGLALAASNRTLREYATDFLTEPLALLLMQIFLLIVVAVRSPVGADRHSAKGKHPAKRRHWWLLGLAGVIFGMLILTRSMFVLWLPGVGLLTVLYMTGSCWRRVEAAGLLCGVALLVCLPWWIHNVVVLERFMPLGTQGSITLLGGYSNAALAGNGDWQLAPELELREELSHTATYHELSDATLREAWIAEVASLRVRYWIRQHLGEIPVLVAKRVYTHWNPYSGRALLWKLAILAGLIGVLYHRQPAALWLVGLPLISTMVVAALYSTGGRFLVPLYGVLFTLGGIGIGYLLQLGLSLRSPQGMAS